MNDIAIFGAGGFGREVACLIRIINESLSEPKWNFIGFFDDNPELKGKMISHLGRCIGSTEDVNAYKNDLSLVMAIGSSVVVRKVVNKIWNPRIDYPNIIHPSFVMSDPVSFQIGVGNIIQNRCSVSTDVSIGSFNVLNGGISFGHDVRISSFNTIMPGVRISGEVTIGDDNFFGVGSIVLQQIKIGNHVRLGAGSVLMTKPKDGNLYMGNPAKKTVF